MLRVGKLADMFRLIAFKISFLNTGAECSIFRLLVIASMPAKRSASQEEFIVRDWVGAKKQEKIVMSLNSLGQNLRITLILLSANYAEVIFFCLWLRHLASVTLNRSLLSISVSLTTQLVGVWVFC